MNDKTATNSDIDMNTYHQEGIDPGDHKVFNISPEIHSFNVSKKDVMESLQETDEAQQKPSNFGKRLDPNLQANVEDRSWRLPGSFRDWNTFYGALIGTNTDFYTPNLSKEEDEDFKATLDEWRKGGGLATDLGTEDLTRQSPSYQKLIREKGLEPQRISGGGDDKDIQRIKMMPGLLTGPTSKGAKQFMSQEEAMARLDKGLRGLMRENWKPGPGSYKTREKSDIDTSVQIKPGKDTVKPSLPQLNILKKQPEELSSEEVKFLSDWYKNQYEGAPSDSGLRSAEDFNIANRDVARLNRPANQNPVFPQHPPEGMGVGYLNDPRFGEKPGHTWGVFDKYGVVTTGFNKQDALNTLYSRQPGLISKAKTPGEQITPSPYEDAVIQQSWNKLGKKMQDQIDAEVKAFVRNRLSIIKGDKEE